ncbi:MAG: helix-turn-helix transcriptional regulator [Planctomycetes bacterium]|nr:helix-turn-helix transcriptional regulator [Planctomycetota bacterium]
MSIIRASGDGTVPYDDQQISVRDARRVIDAINVATEFEGEPEERVEYLLSGLLKLLDRSSLCVLQVCEDLRREPAPLMARRFVFAPTAGHEPLVDDEHLQTAAEGDMHPMIRLVIPRILDRIRTPFTFVASEVFGGEPWFEETIRPAMRERGYVDALMSGWAGSPDRSLMVSLMRGTDEPPFDESDVTMLSLLVRACAPFVDRELFANADPIAEQELTARQREVLLHLLYGSCEKEIAGALSRSVHTVHTYIKQIYGAFNVSSRGELLAMFIDDAVRSAVAKAG